MTLSKNKRHYRLEVIHVSNYGGNEYLFTFYDLDNYSANVKVRYRGEALNIREGGMPLIVGDVIELDARHKTINSYDINLKARVKTIWISYPSNKKLNRVW